MKQRMLFTTLAVLAFAAPAAAEPMRLAQAGAAEFLPPREIVSIVRLGGFDPLDRPMRRGPHYLVRALDERDREVTVVVNGRSGEIVSVTLTATASPMPPPHSGVAAGAYGRTQGYVPPGPHNVYSAGRPVVDEDDPPSVHAPRPPAPVPGVLPRSSAAARPPAPSAAPPVDADDSPPPSAPRVVTSTAPDQYRTQSGALPPPPERFPQRAMTPPAVKPKPPVKRAAVPKQTPLPKPKPQLEGKVDTAVQPPPQATEKASPAPAVENMSAKAEGAAPPQATEKAPLPAVQSHPADAVPN